MKDNKLVGKTIQKVYVAEDRMAIKFITSEGEEIIAKTDGDCCSHSYIQHVEFSSIFPAKVFKVEDVQMSDLPQAEDSYGDVTACYGFKVFTDKGIFFLEYRNDSNGYYGGHLSWDDEYFYGGVHGQNVSNEKWEELKEDF
jgi:hypothetical protein